MKLRVVGITAACILIETRYGTPDGFDSGEAALCILVGEVIQSCQFNRG